MIIFLQHLIIIILVLISITSICMYVYCIRQRIREHIYRRNLTRDPVWNTNMLEILERQEREEREEKEEKNNNNRDLQVPPLPTNSNEYEIQVVDVTLELADAQVVFE